VSLLQRQRLGNHANLSAAARIQSLPEPPLAAPVSPQPLFTASGWVACLGFSNLRRVSHFCFDHEIHIPLFAILGWLPHALPVTRHRERNTKNEKTKTKIKATSQ